jgi:uncharacterized protein (TIGR02271 family)
MLHKEEFIATHPEVRIGMTAYTIDGEKLGVIERIDEDNLTIEKGWFFRKDFLISYDDIMDVREDQIILRHTRDELEAGRAEYENREFGFRGAETEVTQYGQGPEDLGYGQRREDLSGYGRAEEEARIPLREEELEARKREREGEVNIRKDVYTETKHMEVPVQKEDVIVERVPADESRAPAAGEKAFQEEDIRIPLKEEEVEVSKRPVVKEEVRVRKEKSTESQPVSGEVRKEEVKVETRKPSEKKR